MTSVRLEVPEIAADLLAVLAVLQIELIQITLADLRHEALPRLQDKVAPRLEAQDQEALDGGWRETAGGREERDVYLPKTSWRRDWSDTPLPQGCSRPGTCMSV